MEKNTEPLKPSSLVSELTSGEPDIRLKAFVQKQRVVAGHPLRPLTAGPLAYLQLTKNRFLTLQGNCADVLQQIAQWDDLWVQVAGFIFVLAADRDRVCSAVFASGDTFKKESVEFIHDVPFCDIQRAVQEILEMLAELSAASQPAIPRVEGGYKPDDQQLYDQLEAVLKTTRVA